MSCTWFLIADASRARLLASSSSEAPVEVAAFTHPESQMPARAIMTAPLPRTHDRLGSARHAVEPRSRLKDVESSRFARELCEHLDQGQKQRRFDRLVLVAPARFLGQLHAVMGKRLRSAVVGEASKDLVSMPHAALLAQLEKIAGTEAAT